MEIVDLSLREAKILASLILYLPCGELMEIEWTAEAAPRRHEARHLVQQSLGKWCVGLVSRIRGGLFVCFLFVCGRGECSGTREIGMKSQVSESIL